MPITLDVAEPVDIRDHQNPVAATGDGAGRVSLGNRVVQKLVMDPAVLNLGPGKEQIRHPGIGFDIVIQQIINSLVTPGFQPPAPGAQHRFHRVRDHEKHVDLGPEPRQQPGIRDLLARQMETVKPKPVNQQMRNIAPCPQSRHQRVQLLVDDFQLLPGQHRGIFEIIPQPVIIDQVFSPVIRADNRKMRPVQPKPGCDLLLGISDRAFARGRRPLGVQHHRLALFGQTPISQPLDCFVNHRVDQPRDQRIALRVADKVHRNRRQPATIRWLNPAPTRHRPIAHPQNRLQCGGFQPCSLCQPVLQIGQGALNILVEIPCDGFRRLSAKQTGKQAGRLLR